MALIYVVDDSEKFSSTLCEVLGRQGYETRSFSNGPDALNAIAEQQPDVLLLDLAMPEMSGTEVLKSVHREWPGLPVIMISGEAEISSAVETLKLGALDFLEKPKDLGKRLEAALSIALRSGRLQREVEHLRDELGAKLRMVGESPPLQEVRDLIMKVASDETTVLILGESGVGKELVARQIHELSPRREGLYVAVHAAALPDTLLESELFGYEKGAFTGATSRKRGRFEDAAGGTLFLDEIGDISPALQVKLLRFLQERAFVRLGGAETIRVDCRIVAATNHDLVAAVRAGKFREDLYYRLAVFPITVPPLRERKSDIPLLANHILTKLDGGKTLSDDVLTVLAGYSWPGNVRELENVLERAWILARHGEIRVEYIQLPSLATGLHPTRDEWKLGPPEDTLESAKSWSEATAIRAALARTGGDVKSAAEILRVTPKCVYEKLKDLDIDR